MLHPLMPEMLQMTMTAFPSEWARNGTAMLGLHRFNEPTSGLAQVRYRTFFCSDVARKHDATNLPLDSESWTVHVGQELQKLLAFSSRLQSLEDRVDTLQLCRQYTEAADSRMQVGSTSSGLPFPLLRWSVQGTCHLCPGLTFNRSCAIR